MFGRKVCVRGKEKKTWRATEKKYLSFEIRWNDTFKSNFICNSIGPIRLKTNFFSHRMNVARADDDLAFYLKWNYKKVLTNEFYINLFFPFRNTHFFILYIITCSVSVCVAPTKTSLMRHTNTNTQTLKYSAIFIPLDARFLLFFASWMWRLLGRLAVILIRTKNIHKRNVTVAPKWATLKQKKKTNRRQT